jgi:hypothetical protein
MLWLLWVRMLWVRMLWLLWVRMLWVRMLHLQAVGVSCC